jgi:hypothetical protein
LGFGTFKVSLDTEQCYLKLSDLEEVKHEEKMPLADHRSALIRVIEILSKNGRFDCKRLVEQNGKQSNGRMTSGSGLLCLVIPTNEELMIAKKHLLSRTVPNNLHTLVPGAILITAADRNDIMVAAVLAALSHLPIARVILTGDMPIDERLVEFCRPALETGLPLLRVKTNSYDIATQLFQLDSPVAADDLERTLGTVFLTPFIYC